MTFGLVKHNNNSISAITSSGQLAQGKMTLLQTQTASSSASISFTSNIDSTYPIYVFKFINIHPASNSMFAFQASTNTGSSYGVTATTTFFRAQQQEDGSDPGLGYDISMDLSQSTSFIRLGRPLLTDNDASLSGTLKIFNPSSTFVKHYMYNDSVMGNYCQNAFGAGYFNTTSAIDAFQFKIESGNIDSGTIKLYGIKGS